MSNLYLSGESDARKTPITSRGHRHLACHLRGWDDGISVDGLHDSDGSTSITAFATGGSNSEGMRGPGMRVFDGGKVEFTFDGFTWYDMSELEGVARR